MELNTHKEDGTQHTKRKMELTHKGRWNSTHIKEDGTHKGRWNSTHIKEDGTQHT